MGSYSDELRAEGRAQGRAEERATILKILGISEEEYERKLAEKKRTESEA